MKRIKVRIHEHTPAGIKRRLNKGVKQSYLRDWVYGGIDGAITTFAVVSGVVGAELASRTIIILGIANLIADGFSMAAANYIGTKSELDEMRFLADVETEHIKKYPKGEKEEVRQILIEKGFTGTILDQAVDLFTKDNAIWVRFMLSEEYGLPQVVRSPIKASASTFLAFVLCGIIPLLPYLISVEKKFIISSFFTGVVFFLIGSIKSRWSIVSWWRSGLITFFIGTGAALLAYIIGAAISELHNF